MTFNILIVLYKKELTHSIAYNSLLKAFQKGSGAPFTLYIWNNSPEVAMPNDLRGVNFYLGENEYLPNIYNRVAADVLHGKDDFMMISDDDTDYSNVDFEKLLLEVKKVKYSPESNEVGVFIPKIFSNNTLVSPGKRFLFKGSLLGSISSGLMSSKNLLAINSGTIITYDCFKIMSPLFNPELRFYGTDTDFFVRYERYFSKIFILDVSINHSLSEHSHENIGRSLFRWKDHFYATRITFKDSPFVYRWLLAIYIRYMKIKLSLRYKSFKFMGI